MVGSVNSISTNVAPRRNLKNNQKQNQSVNFGAGGKGFQKTCRAVGTGAIISSIAVASTAGANSMFKGFKAKPNKQKMEKYIDKLEHYELKNSTDSIAAYKDSIAMTAKKIFKSK